MDNSNKTVIRTLQEDWNNEIRVAASFFAVATGIFTTAVLVLVFDASWMFVLFGVFLTAWMGYMFFMDREKIGEQDVVQFLDEAHPELQESAHLVVKPYESLNALEKLQVLTIEQRLHQHFPAPVSVKSKLLKAVGAVVMAAAFSILLRNVLPDSDNRVAVARIHASGGAGEKPAQVSQVKIIITPPAYTAKRAREQNGLDITAEQGAGVLWHITTTTAAADVQLLFNDKSILHLQPSDEAHTQWSGRKQVRSAGFYQVKTGADLSPLYQLDMIKDQPPVIVVQSPKPATTINYGQPQKVMIQVSLTDDYGIDSAYIHVTTASGSGEAVKFAAQQLAFPGFSSGSKQYRLQQQADLPALGMAPGDELYFYVNAKDNFHQQKRSDIYIVRMEDTAQLMSMDGMVSSVNVKPEFFRSERQIIIETEQLLKDRDTISVENFNRKSNELGIDQQLLRLRYGKFLGEETETEIGEDHEHNNATQHDAPDIGNADKILDQYSHKHDIAEDATFFDAQTKTQLKATLSEMWKAELQLRTLKPAAALPFEYKALRLLKDLQQQTRVYVAKTGIKTTPLKPETRLTGDLTKIGQPVNEQTFQHTDQATVLRKALGVLEQVKNKETLQLPATAALEQAGVQLSTMAVAQPSVYLAALEALQRIQKNNFTPKDITLAGSALQKMIRLLNNPQQSAAAPDMQLSQRYFMHLNRKND